jgi:hypothetical protein
MGIGMGAFVSAFWMNTIGIALRVWLRLKLSDSTFVWAAMSVFSAGCGMPTLISGPK